MPFDPALPATGSPNSSAEMRGQLNGLHEEILLIPQGPQGPPFAQAVVDGVSTGNPGTPAQVTVSFDGTNVDFTFTIPGGADGAPGAQGPPFASAIVDGVTTLDPGDPASAVVSFDGTNVHFTFGIPRGAPGEVTTAALDAAIAGTSANSNAIALLSLTVSDPPTQAEVQAVANKLDETITALRR